MKGSNYSSYASTLDASTQHGAASEYTPVRSGLLQRKCACGQHTIAGGDCTACSKEHESSLQRSAINREPAHGLNGVPTIVHEVLRSPGQPLDATTRAFMEPRFGHDFSRVRVHTDARAAESAQAVDARAYTLGQDVVFGSAQYKPTTTPGQQLLAHELAHVVQQNSTVRFLSHYEVSNPTDPAEQDAERAALAVTENRPLPRLASATASIHRDAGWAQRGRNDPYGTRLSPWVPGARARPLAPPAQPGNHANQPLTQTERMTASQLTGTAAPSSPLAVPQGPRFVLHDTAGAVGASYIQTQQRLGRGPLAETGSAAFVPSAGPATVTRGSLFDPHRPATTQYERGQDIMVKATREQEYRNVWRATNPTEQSAALDRALASQGLTAPEINAERSTAIAQLNATSGDVSTAASWAVSEICRRVTNAGAASVAASPAVVNDLSGACQRTSPLFAAREARTASTVNVEMVQPAGSGPATTGALTRLPDYTDVQYQNVMLLYLQSALQVGQFPEITTHFWIDKNVGDHVDPRCFNLSRFYSMIGASLGHGRGSSYGIAPNYGTGRPHNVWWNDTVCGGPHP